MNIFKEIRNELENILDQLKAEGALPADAATDRITIEPPRDASHGDMATNAAMLLAKPAKMKPRDIAEMLVGKLQGLPLVSSAEIAGPGFINLRLDNSIWQKVVAAILERDADFARSEMGQNKKVNVEYVSANPTGPLHIGHARGAVFGDILAELLLFAGYDVTKEYYVNDAGAQVDVLGRSSYLRYKEAHGETIEIPEGLYPGDYLKAVGQALKDDHGDALLSMKETVWLPICRAKAVKMMMDGVKEDLKELGINQDVFTSERALVDANRVQDVYDSLDANGYLYTGVLEPPKGKKPDDWEPRPQTLFKATDHGDDVDRPLKKSDGSWTYFANDIANHLDKYQRGFTQQIDIFGADHGGYVKRMLAATSAVTEGKADLDIKLCQLVKLMDKGQPIKMSKRAGTFVTLRDLVDEVGKDVVRFFLLTRKNDAPLDFDLSAVKEQSRDNPVWYVQYAHARCCSVFRQAAEAFDGIDLSKDALSKADLTLLNDPAIEEVVKLLASMPRLIEAAAEAHEPHRVAFYMMDVAAAFHGLWAKGKENTHLRFVAPDNKAQTMANLALLEAVRSTIAAGLEIFGVEPVRELH
ncbi:arginine--tRNA ligase [Curvivirga aplysinae]|uniref:arginine--tRNA ligase n=1 Tax=Curvivirga aplysinae TaxID=2529852 RepID=UPI0012BD1664|nr:arginine--tRNA ligase [Curvivirga aplysinae]MTI10697.1 arginine--tRNA ligase [Curvivirga aplysinae]